jgi:hypothetical protein
VFKANQENISVRMCVEVSICDMYSKEMSVRLCRNICVFGFINL